MVNLLIEYNFKIYFNIHVLLKILGILPVSKKFLEYVFFKKVFIVKNKIFLKIIENHI